MTGTNCDLFTHKRTSFGDSETVNSASTVMQEENITDERSYLYYLLKIGSKFKQGRTHAGHSTCRLTGQKLKI